MSLYNPRNSPERPKRVNCTGATLQKALLLQVLLLFALFSFPTTHAQDYSINPVVPSPTPVVETEVRQVDPSQEEQGLPLQILQVDDIQMIISGVSTLSSASQTAWAQTTIDFIANTVGQALVEQTVGYVELALQMGAWTMSVTDQGRLLMEFAITLDIKSSTTFTQESGERIILNGFDEDEEKFAYISALKNTQDAAFENAVDVVVTIDDGTDPEEEETSPPVETTDPPTVSPTVSPTRQPTREPTVTITVVTDAPTMSPTTPDPTAAPTSSPSPPPGAPTAAPTLSPPPTTASPTAAATLPLQRFQAKNIEMVLEGMQPLYLVAQSIWREETAAFIEAEITDMVSSQETVGVSIDFTSQDPPFQGRRLQQDAAATEVLKVTFDAVVSIRSESNDHDVNEYITSAFDSPEQEEMYMDNLKTTGYEAFDNLSGVSITTTQIAEPGEEEPSQSPTPPPPSNNNNLGTTIGISVGLVVVACIASAALAFFIVSRRKDKKPSMRAESPLSTAVDSHHGMHYADEIEVGSRSDISTLGDPIPAGMRYGDVCEGGTMFTAATDGLSTDYDFQKEFHRSQLSVMDSTVGGDSELCSDFIPKDSMSLDEEYLMKNRFEVEAPAGLLGLVIDTSEEGYPTIRAIKDSSCLTGQVQVGDILLSVDNEDVTPMMASTVSRLISSKSQNSVRRFVFSRLEEEGMA